MFNIITEIYLRIIRRRRRGMTRVIDFLVAFSLFIVLVSQFYLVLLNVSLNLSQGSSVIENPAEEFAFRLLGSSGSSQWGTSTGNPISFGLANDYSNNDIPFIDLNKLARLNPELQNLSININYSYIDPSFVLNETVGSGANYHFRISTRPLIQVTSIFNGGASTIETKVQTWNNLSLANVNTEIIVLNITDNIVYNNITGVTDSNGETNVTVSTSPDTNYIGLVYAHSGSLWGYDWVEIKLNVTKPIYSEGISSFVMPNPNKTNNDVLIYSEIANSSISGNISSITAYYNPLTGSMNFYSNSSAVDGPLSLNLTQTGLGTVFQIQTINDVNAQYYRIISIPMILDNFNFTDILNLNNSISQFPVYQTDDFDNKDFYKIYSYNTLVTSIRGNFLLTIEIGYF